MSNDVDFEQFIKILDGALASKDPKVKDALRKFLFVAALAMGDDMEPGPFTKMMDTIDRLQQRVSTLENQNSDNTYTTSSPWTTPPGWYYNYDPSIMPSTGGTGTSTSSGSSTTITSTTPWTSSSGGCIGIGQGLSTSNTYWTSIDDTLFNSPGNDIKKDVKEKLTSLLKSD